MNKKVLIAVVIIIIFIGYIFLLQKKQVCGDSIIIDGKKHSTIKINGNCFWSEKFENSISSRNISAFANKTCSEDFDCKSLDLSCGCCRCSNGNGQSAINKDWYSVCPPAIKWIQQIECNITMCKMACIGYEPRCIGGYCESVFVDRKNN